MKKLVLGIAVLLGAGAGVNGVSRCRALPRPVRSISISSAISASCSSLSEWCSWSAWHALDFACSCGPRPRSGWAGMPCFTSGRSLSAFADRRRSHVISLQSRCPQFWRGRDPLGSKRQQCEKRRSRWLTASASAVKGHQAHVRSAVGPRMPGPMDGYGTGRARTRRVCG
jgi:hypothetical protein